MPHDGSFDAQVRALAHEVLGYEPAGLSESAIRVASGKRARAHGVGHEAYVQLLVTEPSEQRALCQELLVVESWLFREIEPIVAALRDIRTRQPHLKVLSVPCARGEEPITVLALALQAGFASDQISITGYDISERAIAQARRFELSPYSFRGVPAHQVHALFESAGSCAVLSSQLRHCFCYVQANVTDEGWEPHSYCYDLVLCRNLLVYLDRAAQEQLLTKLGRALNAEGVLIVSAAEAGVVPNSFRSQAVHPVVFRYATPSFLEKSLASQSMQASVPSSAHRSVTKSEAITLPRHAAQQNAKCISPLEAEIRMLHADDAFSLLLEVIDREPTHAEAHYLLATLFSAAGQNRLAFDCVCRALELSPQYEDAQLLRATFDTPRSQEEV